MSSQNEDFSYRSNDISNYWGDDIDRTYADTLRCQWLGHHNPSMATIRLWDALMIQEMINDATPGSTINPVGEFQVAALTPVRLKSQLTIDLREAIITEIANTQIWHGLFLSEGCEEVTLLGGQFRGERYTHTGPNVPEGGGGAIVLYKDKDGKPSRNIKILGADIMSMFGDGIALVYGQGVEIAGVKSHGNRRQGMSVAAVNGLYCHDNQWLDNGGVEPGAGIDFEPDTADQIIENVQVRRDRFSGNKGAGALIACPPAQRHNITIGSDCVFVGKPIDGSDGIVPFYSKWLAQIGLGPTFNWYGYPRSLYIP